MINIEVIMMTERKSVEKKHVSPINDTFKSYIIPVSGYSVILVRQWRNIVTIVLGGVFLF
jgi:hypothetical protein